MYQYLTRSVKSTINYIITNISPCYSSRLISIIYRFYTLMLFIIDVTDRVTNNNIFLNCMLYSQKKISFHISRPLSIFSLYLQIDNHESILKIMEYF